jgi:hypothetical protein
MRGFKDSLTFWLNGKKLNVDLKKEGYDPQDTLIDYLRSSLS